MKDVSGARHGTRHWHTWFHSVNCFFFGFISIDISMRLLCLIFVLVL